MKIKLPRKRKKAFKKRLNKSCRDIVYRALVRLKTTAYAVTTNKKHLKFIKNKETREKW